MMDKWMGKEIEVGSDVLKAVDDGVERCFLIALASLSSRGVWGFAVKFTSLIEKLSSDRDGQGKNAHLKMCIECAFECAFFAKNVHFSI